MPTKDELLVTIEGQEKEIESLNERINVLEQNASTHDSNIEAMSKEKDEAIKILEDDNVALMEENLTLKNQIDEEDAPDIPDEQTITLVWDGPVDTSSGVNPTAYGFNLDQDEDGIWTSEIPESAVESITSRDGSYFIDPSAVEESTEDE